MAAGTAMKILLVEDNLHDAELVRRHLQRDRGRPWVLEVCRTLEEATARFGSKLPDVALVDLDLADSWGLATLQKVRALAPQVPVVVLTGGSADQLAVEALREGAQDYLPKAELGPALLQRTLEHAVERHRLLGLVTQSERLASVGQLSAGMAHELNSPLAQVMAELTELEEGLAGGLSHARLSPVLDRALERLEHIRVVVDALHAFSTGQGGRRTAFDPARSIRLARRLLEGQFGPGAEFDEEVPPLPAIIGDQGQFTQAVLDMLGHAHRSRRPGESVHVRAEAKDGSVVVTVASSGRGSDDGAPAVTAKDSVGRITTVAAAVARDFGGDLRTGDAGLILRVPADVRAPASRPEPVAAVANAAERARVLWIDDDAHLLRAFKRRLDRDHDVEVCESARDALERIEGGARWDVICCDLMMPDMSGREFEQTLAVRFPELARRVIFVTGGVFTEEERRFLEESRQPRLLKPFEWDDLLDAVAEVRLAA